MEIIGIDHGYGQMKTVNSIFQSGVVEYEGQPYTQKDVIYYRDKYYVCGSERQGLIKNKTEEIYYFVLTLVAIAKEILSRGLRKECDVMIAAGLPLTSFGREKEKFERYLKASSPVKFLYENQRYKINIVAVKVFPQAYAAVAWRNELLNKEPSQILIDIGSWTVDCMIINNSIPDASSCRSLELGAIRCIEETQEEIRRKTGLAVTSLQVQQILMDKPCTVQREVKEIVLKQRSIYAKKIFRKLEESGFDTRAVPTIFMGGGVKIIKPYLEDRNVMKVLDDMKENAKGYEIIAKQVIKNGII